MWRPRSSVRSSSAEGALIFAPAQADVEAALREGNAPAGWLVVDPEAGAAATRARRDARRQIGRNPATRLEVQGIAGVTSGKTVDEIAVTLLAGGSAEPGDSAILCSQIRHQRIVCLPR